MKIIFFGTPDFVVPILEALHKKYNSGRERELIGVVTQAPKPVGREKKLEYSAVDTFAHTHKIAITHSLDDLPAFDLGICAAYGKIIPTSVIAQAKRGILNVHPSLLPKYRGASPVQATIAAGDTETGVTIIKMDEDLDHGPVVSYFKDTVNPTETNEELRARLFERTAEFLLNLIPAYVGGDIKLKEQMHETATFTKIITREDGFIEGMHVAQALNGETPETSKKIRFMNGYEALPDAVFIERMNRALTPWPEIHTLVRVTKEGEQKRLKLLKTDVIDNRLILKEVQLEGKNPVTWEQFHRGYPDASFE